jgi:hypothetical protein
MKVWTLSASQYQAIKGVPAPHIAEISPMQYGNLSGRGKAQYDAKRAAEWDASIACKQEWRDAVIAAHDAEEFNQHDPEVSSDARHVILHETRRRAGEVAQYKLREATKANLITSPDQIKAGDRVFSVMSNHYVIIEKVNAKSLRTRFEHPPAWAIGKTFKENYGAIQFLAPRDLSA